MPYRRIVVSRFGGPEVLQVIEDELRDPRPGEVRVKVLAAGVAWPDYMMRHGVYPRQPKLPFTPGYDVVGIVDQTGAGATLYRPGQKVAALLIYGGYSEYVFIPEQELVPVPEDLDPAETVCLVLNYVTAYQMLHRAVHLQTGRRMLVHSAAGGVGTALLQLGRLIGLQMFGTASQSKHGLIENLGAHPIDYRNEDFVEWVLHLTRDGVDLVCDAIGGTHWLRSYRCLRPGGTLLAYGSQALLVNGRKSLARTVGVFITAMLLYARPGHGRFKFYSITTTRNRHPQWFREDLAALLQMLRERRIQPIIAERLPFTEARLANELLEQGAVQGKVVLTF
ncbi:MAG: medium chain dehydrogenase/reductase family protein [Acidobacteriia bacterium]|nr:medium chain dehydrogenase/reductase family protein [Terriglobia bacterium]